MQLLFWNLVLVVVIATAMMLAYQMVNHSVKVL